MPGGVLAGAGLSDCVQSGADDCLPGFGTFVILLGVGVIVGIAVLAAWLSMATAASIDIARSGDRSLPGKALWTVAVWVLPIVGVLLWRWCDNHAHMVGID
ncbi:PLDc N-terminal domain-containing protein [Prescottella subtropica]|uniref:PLDc N-terminal domain-containing protein n=1 Tax=Prescottella subtropica TaxID=2545757 RepID=UPI0010F9030D|nr:PLDc N-terminal domain-containing protein [Prescottella subtropica]